MSRCFRYFSVLRTRRRHSLFILIPVGCSALGVRGLILLCVFERMIKFGHVPIESVSMYFYEEESIQKPIVTYL